MTEGAKTIIVPVRDAAKANANFTARRDRDGSRRQSHRAHPGLTLTVTPPPARSASERRRDALHRLEQDVDAWVASADPGTGTASLVPLSFLWDGDTLLIATPATSPTGRNLQTTGRVRIGLGPTRDVVLSDGTVTAVAPAVLLRAVGDAFAARTGFDPRRLSTPYLYFRVEPRQLQAWREENELEGRVIMRAGRWVGS